MPDEEGATVPCCHLHRAEDCCDPDDCGPCCEDCPTCPTLRRMRAPKVPEGLRRAIAEARKDPEFADRIEWLKQQNFNPLAVIQKGIEDAARAIDTEASA